MVDNFWMQVALYEAKKAALEGEIPIGAVLVHNNTLIAVAHNQSIQDCDPTAHAEIRVLRKAGLISQNYRLNETTLYVTLTPCSMCMGALIHARIKRLVIGAMNTKGENHQIQILQGVMSQECSFILSDFFKTRR